MGTIKQFNVATTGPNAGLLRKVTRVDRREAPGVLFLGGPAHPAAPSLGGVADGLRVQNAMLDTAKVMVGSGDATTLGAQLTVGSTVGNGTKGIIERTAKGGIHTIISQAQNLAVGPDGAAIQLDTLLRAYMHAHRTDSWYVSLWARMTRATVGGFNSGIVELGAGSTSPDYMLALMQENGVSAQTITAQGNDDGTTQQAAGGSLKNALAPVRRWAAVSGKSSVVQTSPWPRVGPSWGWYGGTYNAASSTSQNKLPSWVFYELMIENLTVSGRTYAEASAVDHDAFVSAFSAGGRYYSDTFTAPSTLP